MTSYTRLTALFAALFLLSLWCGCSWIHRAPPSYSPDVSALISSFKRQNHAIQNANGLATVTLTAKGETQRYRLAWATEKPDRLRMIVLFSGKPVETVLYNGTHLVVKSHTQSHNLIKRRTKNPNLEKLIALPLRVNQLVDLLSGSLPLPDHRSARLANNPQGGYTLALLNRKAKPVIIFYLNDTKQPTSCSFTDRKGNRYLIRFKAASSHEALTLFLAEDITIENQTNSLHLRMDQLNPNPGLSAETFKMISE